VIKLTRLNRSVVAINPDHICWVDISPDTTLCLIGGDKIIVRESLEELIDAVVAYRRQIHQNRSTSDRFASIEGDPPSQALLDAAKQGPESRRLSSLIRRTTLPPASAKFGPNSSKER
jgi:flagellar protein FlbD